MLMRAAYMQVQRGDCADPCEERGRVDGIAAAGQGRAAAITIVFPSRQIFRSCADPPIAAAVGSARGRGRQDPAGGRDRRGPCVWDEVGAGPITRYRRPRCLCRCSGDCA